ncbi:MAG: YidC/Oxa1 family membrane protein insertase [Candidatus Peribacteraceae bacterium]|nr:YidC/Oxa1 family membrane protein insertase [Candidatus Peribacteraceae bacterium]MDD5742567.1 YidC/Oxa1 family membrane protein insertase [Candidatus Peribacteraceae bacterium]
MPETPRKRSALLEFALIFAIVYLGTQLVFRLFFPQQAAGPNSLADVVLKPDAAHVKGDHSITLSLRNNTEGTLLLMNRCPMPPVSVFSVTGEGSGAQLAPLFTTETAVPCTPLTEVAPKSTARIDLGPWKYSLFSQYGTYEVRLPSEATFRTASGAIVPAEYGTLSGRVTLSEAGPFTRLFRAFITKPFLNFLIFIASVSPGHSLGVAIIILTLVVKFLLFIPTQHSLEGQKKMQKAQPILDEIRRKYKDDPKRMQEETMKVWKEHGINPFQSCLPLLIQMPVLIGVFYVVRDGSVLELSRHLIYPFYQHLDWTFGTTFLGLDLLQSNFLLFSPLLVILQFIQMKLTFAAAKKKKAQQGDKSKAEGDKSQQLQQQMMLYGLPLMIGVFAYQFPSAVSLYWGVSTLFAIGQQIVVNREKITL